jgi:hypothetical protein
MPRAVLIILLIFITFSSYSQTKITWETLEDVSFTDKYSKEVKAYYYFPRFGSSVLALNNREVIIKGYVLEIDRGNDVYILSANPFAACFFVEVPDQNPLWSSNCQKITHALKWIRSLPSKVSLS